MGNIQRNIGHNLRNIRKSRGLSLDHTAELTGVSKAMLGQIERGESNPTVTTLWKIASGLQISFSSLISEDPTDIQFVQLDHINPVIELEGNYRVYSIFPFDPRRKFEIYIVEIEPGFAHISEHHNEGVEEYITVMEGQLDMLINEDIFHVSAGNSIRFLANKTHTYSNPGNSLTRIQVVMYYA